MRINRLTCSLGISIIISISACKPRNSNSGLKIIGGQEVISEDDVAARSTVLLNFPNGLCTGVLIGPSSVLTAAHCNPGNKKATVTFFNGEKARGYTTKILGANGEYEYSRFDPTYEKENDIAILTLVSTRDNSVPYVAEANYTPLELITKKLDPKTSVVIAGYGRTIVDDPNSKRVLHSTNVEIDSYDYKGIPGTIYWKSPEGLSNSACKSDSGGPMIYFDTETNKPKLVGVTSHGALGEPCDGNGVYTSAIHFSDWISRFVNASDAILVEPTVTPTNTSSNQSISNNNPSRQTGASLERPARGPSASKNR